MPSHAVSFHRATRPPEEDTEPMTLEQTLGICHSRIWLDQEFPTVSY